MVCDCESELFREKSRGLEGGSFFLATILNRKEAKTAQGKNGIDSLKDFYLLKSDGRFCQYFLSKFDIDPTKDNTPDLMKSARAEEKIKYLHSLVSECLRDLLPFFKAPNLLADSPTHLHDHPLQEGRKASRQQRVHPAPHVRHPEPLGMSSTISFERAEDTAASVVTELSRDNYIEEFLERFTVAVSSTRTRQVYSCKLCKYESKYETVCLTHIEKCLENITPASQNEAVDSVDETDQVDAPDIRVDDSDIFEQTNENDQASAEIKGDMYFNYKNGEFFVDSIFAITTVFERFGDGVGCLIASKILLPIFHGLKHSNYTCTIHRFITRVLCEANPREALKLIHERFSNRAGKPGKNVFRDRRMEFRIGITKKLLENLGPNFNEESVKQVNQSVDVKEELYLKTRQSHGVKIRSGRHIPRSDEKDFSILMQNLTQTEAQKKIEGRKFGSFALPENILDDKRFDKASFYRWIANKNEEAKEVLEAKVV